MSEFEQQTNNGGEPEQFTGENDQPAAEKKIIASRVNGSVKWFNVKNGYGFITREDTNEDVFVHQSAISKNNPNKYKKSLGENERVEFDIIQGDKGQEATNVSGPNGEPVQGSIYAAEKRIQPNRSFNNGGPGGYAGRPPRQGFPSQGRTFSSRSPNQGGINYYQQPNRYDQRTAGGIPPQPYAPRYNNPRNTFGNGMGGSQLNGNMVPINNYSNRNPGGYENVRGGYQMRNTYPQGGRGGGAYQQNGGTYVPRPQGGSGYSKPGYPRPDNGFHPRGGPGGSNRPPRTFRQNNQYSVNLRHETDNIEQQQDGGNVSHA